MRVCLIVPFLNEEELLPRVIDSLVGQTRRADTVILLDDGSTDASPAIAAAAAEEHQEIRVLRRPRRPPARDRLLTAAEYQAFQWAVGQLDERYDVVAKLDADIELTAATLETVVAAFDADLALGIAGTWTQECHDGIWRRETHPEHHVRGGTKYYRWTCYEACGALPATLGWDTIDDLTARSMGWTTRSLSVPSGDPLHHRPTGGHDGRARGFHRWGQCAWAYGATFPYVVAGATARVGHRPRVVGALAYVVGYVDAALHRLPRADARVRRQQRREERARLWRAAGQALSPLGTR